MIGLGVPYTALGNLSGDSGYIEVIEPLSYMAQHYGVKSLVYVDGKFADKPLSMPAGVDLWPSSDVMRAYDNGYKWALGADAAFRSFPGAATRPIDFVFTNKKQVVATMAALGLDKRCQMTLVPIILDVLKVGLDTHDVMYEDTLKHEALSYATAAAITFSTAREKELGLTIARRFLSPAMVREIDQKAIVQADGISPDLLKVRLTKEQVCNRLQKKRKTLNVVFIGRMNTNKGIDMIVDTVRPLFALHGVKLSMISPSANVPKSKRLLDVHNLFDKVHTSVPKQQFINEILPACDLVLNASHHEGYTVTVAEAVYAGVPVLLPDRPWAKALVGQQYPFLYNGKTQMYAWVQSFRQGVICNAHLRDFERSRSRFERELSTQTGETVYRLALKAVEKVDARMLKEPHGKILDAFLDKFPIGKEFTIPDIVKVYPAISGVRVASGGAPFAYDAWSVYKFVKPFIEVVSATDSVFRRIK